MSAKPKPIKALLDVPQRQAADAIQRRLSEQLGVDLTEADTVRLGLRNLGQSVQIDFPIIASNKRSPT